MHDELRHFVLVAEHGTFTRAAKSAHLSQPALSASIRRLEAFYGGRLFNRGRHGASLTPSGEELLPRVRSALALLRDGRRAVRELQGLERGEVRVGAGATACTYLLPRFIAAFRKRYPEVRIRLREAFGPVLRQQVENGELDLAIVTDSKVGKVFYRDELLVVSGTRRGARSDGFVTFPRGSATRRLLLQRYPRAQVEMELSSIASVLSHARAGVGLALVSRLAAKADLKAKRLRISDPKKAPIKRTLRILPTDSLRLPPAAAEFRRMLLEEKELLVR